MGAAIGTDEWWVAQQKRREESRRERSAEHLASGDDIPDIDFSVDCPICDGPLEYDEILYCVICNIGWGKNGYGHQAERFAALAATDKEDGK